MDISTESTITVNYQWHHQLHLKYISK
jgi:hypothetical protein